MTETDDSTIFDTCEECDGWGGWTETYERSGRDFEVDVPCNECGGTGVR
jgi:DnaJ-class molecular chaperone